MLGSKLGLENRSSGCVILRSLRDYINETQPGGIRLGRTTLFAKGPSPHYITLNYADTPTTSTTSPPPEHGTYTTITHVSGARPHPTHNRLSWAATKAGQRVNKQLTSHHTPVGTVKGAMHTQESPWNDIFSGLSIQTFMYC